MAARSAPPSAESVLQVQPAAALGRAGMPVGRAAGEFILFLDGDTELQPDFLSHALVAMEQSDVAICWGHRRESRPEQS